ncbi:DNA/RNA helicase domain-containing protein [Rhodoferax sp.]|uniref:DNA/RNA helicase domain-containing protein n=1 Tax=Rhodoferax sp. TaxID=50421 RepID=UPI00274BEA79|nr:DUF2075 domain-containing protein [Rhodoferax sp.]
MPVRDFCRAVKSNRVFSELERAYHAETGRKVGRAELDSWAGSLPRLSGVLELSDFSESVYVGLEVQIPYYSERIDAALYGHDLTGQPFVVLVELKQWSALDSDNDGRLHVRMRSGVVPVTHPSLQVSGYRRHLTNFVRAFHNEPSVQIACCVYTHNYPRRAGTLFSPEHFEAISQAPVFCATDAEVLAEYLRARVGKGRGAEVNERIRREGFAPSKLLIDSAAELIRHQDVFTMLDEQIPAQKSIVRAIGRAIQTKSKSIILVDGGPGTGKSVVALDALGYALRKNRATFLVSGSAAFTFGMRKLLGPDLASLVRFTDFFWEHDANSIDVLIIDEAHRIRAKSVPKVMAERRPKISQLEELVLAAKVTILFMDTNQIIEPGESGDPEQVVALAQRLGIKFERHHLRAQFRCDGSDEYLKWIDRLLDLSANDEPQLLRSPETFDFDVLDSPHGVLAWVQNKNAIEPNSARLTAGWCWPWSDPNSDGTLVNDISIGDFTFPWELKNGKKGLSGVPEAKHWAVHAAGAQQAGTVYSVQGFEFRHVGVFMGPDLVVRNGRWIANPRANFRNSIRAKSSDVVSIYLRRIYRTLLTRPLRSIRVYSVDTETREFLRSRIERGSRVPLDS